MKLSIVATLYQSAPHIHEFHQRASAVAQELVDDDYEIILVNDGSPDNSLDLAIQLAENDGHLVVVDLSRNFGHHKAMLTGLSHAKGGRVFLIDSDLEEEPEWLLKFERQIERDSCDVVYGVQSKRKGGWFERLSGWLFYKIFNILTDTKVPANMVTARLMTRRYLDALLLHEERALSIGGLYVITGFQQSPATVQKHNRSESTYSFGHKMAVMIDSVTSFSNKPLISIFYIGLIILLVAGVNVAYQIFNWAFYASVPSGYTSVMASIWLLGGLIIMLIGIVGIYLSKVFTETKQRPTSIVRQIYNKSDL